jgi:hypothetical protein
MILALRILQEQVWGDSLIECLSLFTLLGAFGTLYHHIECHHENCHRLGRFKHGHLHLCHIHHPLVSSSGKITDDDISKISQQ